MVTKTCTVKEMKKILDNVPDDYKVYFSEGFALYGMNEWKVGSNNKRIIFRE